MSGVTWNPFTDNLDFTGGTGTLTIPEYATDPVSPVVNQAWVLVTAAGGGGANSGVPMGLLLALTYAGGAITYSYKFSYYTTEGTTVRTTLS